MSNSTPGKYADYTVRIAEDMKQRCSIETDVETDRVMRVTYRVARRPSRKEFILRHYCDATAEERADAEGKLDRLHIQFRRWENAGGVFRYRNSDGGWLYIARCGYAIDDPLIQLELEMMIDLESGVTA